MANSLSPTCWPRLFTGGYDVFEVWATLRWTYSPSFVTVWPSKFWILHFVCKRDKRTDGWTDDLNTRCLRRTFQAGGIKNPVVLFCVLFFEEHYAYRSIYPTETRGPNRHISCTLGQCSTFVIDCPGRPFLFTDRLENTNLMEDREILLSIKLRWIPVSGSRGQIYLSQAEAGVEIFILQSVRKIQTWYRTLRSNFLSNFVDFCSPLSEEKLKMSQQWEAGTAVLFFFDQPPKTQTW